MRLSRHVSKECFNQHLFILSKELERCLGIPHPIVQKETPNQKCGTLRWVRTFLWKPNVLLYRLPLRQQEAPTIMTARSRSCELESPMAAKGFVYTAPRPVFSQEDAHTGQAA
jgi:hypothetical protein